LISIFLAVPEAAKDEVIAELWDAGTTGITEEADSLRAFFDDDCDTAALERRFSAYHPAIEREEDRDWVKESQDRWEPFPVGERFFLVPEWRDDSPPAGRLRLTTYPGMACGTGTHPATQLCLMAMEKHLRDAESVLDVGTGSGILAQAAVLLGAGRVAACDIEHDAAVIALANFRKTGADIGVFTGSLRSVRTASVDLAVANLNAATLTRVGEDMKRVAARLILSGFRVDETDRVVQPLGVDIADILTLDDWGCVVTSSHKNLTPVI
jgi:ribosomal protein L11 methyltransferase